MSIPGSIGGPGSGMPQESQSGFSYREPPYPDSMKNLKQTPA
ncbi:MAG: hypothetical protein O2820_06040 [Planctomycetota bacterium]|nr:hypothetical protein [Planctomycetota bacterium]MDA1248768.1 hypothetical protein [Planctomycetota bacterium]